MRCNNPYDPLFTLCSIHNSGLISFEGIGGINLICEEKHFTIASNIHSTFHSSGDSQNTKGQFSGLLLSHIRNTHHLAMYRQIL
ncbi:hypothetical protein GDO81_029109 [Engystomops pustulosus]|uniref:Uncharacterized protein n=1 Tax=Engystomops pustulosus TaxID=76066 RepID=A0AAV6ZRG8_ENGPU|nr:hypothetical protein GDO81_029109 [Engystomops pustulosus]